MVCSQNNVKIVRKIVVQKQQSRGIETLGQADGRCYYCQMDFEVDLKVKPIRWFAYRRLKDLRNMEAIEKDMIQWIDEMDKQKEEKIFDMSVANAMANDNVEMTINKNKQ